MDSEHFYEHLPPFGRFRDITEDAHFVPVPEDWSVVLTDVERSTEAIDRGRYKDVNTIGAAAIVCGHHGMAGLALPYVFGGDGASMLIPPARLEATMRELAALRDLSETRFGLGLRVGSVGVAELLAEGVRLEVAKFELTPVKCIAIFRGGGLALAERKIKGEPERYRVPSAPSGPTALGDLSCRWQPVPSRNGQVLSLLVVARTEHDGPIYARVLDALERAMGDSLESANPVHRSAMRYRGIWACLTDERRYVRSMWSRAFLARVLHLLVAVLALRYRLPSPFFAAQRYAASIPVHCDYRKFDDALRLVIDCTRAQSRQIEEMLDRMHREGAIYYGLHASNEALMTCFVHSTEPGEHIHFIDGGDGGYAMAAKQLKAQVRPSA